MNECSIDGCGSPVTVRGWCKKHYSRWQRHGDPLVSLRDAPRATCSIDDCTKLARCRGLCDMHYTRWRRHGDPQTKLNGWGLPEKERFWLKVGTPIGDAGCWPWTGATGDYGHGIFATDAGPHVQAHKWLWEQTNGPVPQGLELDHLCRTAGCVNPEHLDPVTHRENVLRGDAPSAVNAAKTHCKWGHPFDEANTYRPKPGHRTCRTCARNYQRRLRARRRTEAQA